MINQEEYEILKGLDDKYKWVARDSGGELWAYKERPFKGTFYWVPIGSYCGKLPSGSKRSFQFIQWEDEEPHGIAELIKEYESQFIETYNVQKELEELDRLEESEESEEIKMKKDIEWAKKEIKELMTEESQNYPHDEMVEKEIVLGILNQLDEPEVPVVQEDVYEYMTQQKRDRYTIQQVFYQVHWNYKNESMAEEEEWVSGNEEEFAKAWLAYPNIEVEKEQKYYARLKEIRPLEGEWLTNLSGPNYYVLDTKGLMLGEFILDLVGMKTEASTHTLKDWERYGINDSNADFVKAEELEE